MSFTGQSSLREGRAKLYLIAGGFTDRFIGEFPIMFALEMLG
jgi:hypothetical protein